MKRSMNGEVVVVIGAGGIGLAIARRQGAGKSVLLADVNEGTLQAAAQGLEATGYSVTTQRVDVSSRESIRSLAGSGGAGQRRPGRRYCWASPSSWRSSAR